MSTTDASNQYAQADEYIQYKLQKARRRIKWADLLTAGLLAAVLLIGYVFVFTVLDHWVVGGGFAPWTRAIGLGVVVISCIAILVRYVAMPWFKTIHPLYAARVLDSSGSGLRGALVSLVDLNSGPDKVSNSVRSVMEKRAAVSLADVNVDDAIDQRWLMKLAGALFVLVVLTSVYAIASPKGINLLRPLTVVNAAVATQTRILKVDPGTTTIAAGESLEVFVDVGGQLPDEVILEYTTRDKTYVNEALTLSVTESDSKFQTIIVGESDRGLRQDFSYRIVAGDAVSEDFRVTVSQPPTANVVELNYEYPNYMVLPRQETADGNIAAWEGTKVQLVAEASVPVKRAVLKFSDSSTFDVPAEEINLVVQGQQILGEFTLQLRDDNSSAKFYRIEVQDYDGRTDPQPTVYAVNIRPDKAPLVKLLDPIRDLNVPANSIVPLLVQAEDPDFMLRNVKLEYDINGEIRTPELLYDGTRSALTRKWTGRFEFRLEDLEVRPGDVVNYYVTARDNKPPLGSMSRTSNLKLVIMEEASKEEVQQKLKQDREIQDQEFKQQTNQQEDQKSGEGQPGEGQSAEGEGQEGENQSGENQGTKNQPGANGQKSNDTGEAAPNGSQQSDPESQNTGEADPNSQPENQPSNSSADPKDGKQNQPDSKQSDGENGAENGGEQNQQNQNGNPGDNSTTSENSQEDGTGKPGATNSANDPANPNQVGDNLNPDQGQSSEAGPSRSLDDGEAMQKLLDKYREQNGDAAPPTETDPTADGKQNDSPGEESKSNQNQQSAGEDANPKNPDSSADPANTKSGSATDDASTDPDSQDPDADPKNTAGGPNEDQKDAAQDGSGQKPDSDMKQPEQESGEQSPNDGNEQKPGQQDGKQSGESKPGQQDGKQGGESKPGQQDGKQGGESKSGQQDGKQGGESKPGQQDGKQGGESKSGQQDGKQGGESKSGQQDGKQGGESKSGQQDGKQGGESKSGQQDGKQGGESKSGQQDGKQGGESKPGQQDGKQGGESKPGQQDGKQGAESKPGQQDGKQGAESKSGQKDGKQGAESKSGQKDGKQGAESKSGQKDGKQGAESKPGQKDGKQGAESKSGEKGGEKPGAGGGQQQGGKPGEGQSGSAKGQQGGMGAKGGSAGAPQGDAGAAGSGAAAGSDFQSEDPNVQSSAEAADLVLKRLQQDLQRGEVDQELLDELGWNEDQLKQFNARMQKKLDTLKPTEDPASKAEQLRRRRAEELLKSLNLKGNAADRIGQDNRDIEQQDTTSRRSAPPARYRGWMEQFQRGLSKGKPQPRE